MSVRLFGSIPDIHDFPGTNNPISDRYAPLKTLVFGRKRKKHKSRQQCWEDNRIDVF